MKGCDEVENLIINIIGIFILIWLFRRFFFKGNLQRRKEFHKSNLIGSKYSIQRDNGNDIHVLLYEYDNSKNNGLIIVGHGGALIDGDVERSDLFCDTLRNKCECTVVSVDYQKLGENKLPYQQQEFIDTVKYFVNNASKYQISASKIIFVGFSGGSYLEIGAASILASQNLPIKSLFSFYPLLDDSIINLTDMGFLRFPITIISANNSVENERIGTWKNHLDSHNVSYEHKEYSDAMMGFIEYQFEEYIQDPAFAKRLKQFDDEQCNMAQACMMWLENEINQLLNE